MVKELKPQTLKERIGKITVSDTVDPDVQSHYDEVLVALGTIGQLEEFSLLDPESANLATKQFSEKLEKLQRNGKQVKAVNTLLRARKGIAKELAVLGEEEN